MKTAAQVLADIKEAAEQCVTKEGPKVRHSATLEVGEAPRQGDVYLTRIADGDTSNEWISTDRQLAPGTSKGSRHIVSASTDAKFYLNPDRGPLEGPKIVAKSRLLVEHPEHDHLDLPAGSYQVTYQRDYKKERAEEIRRVAD